MYINYRVVEFSIALSLGIIASNLFALPFINVAFVASLYLFAILLFWSFRNSFKPNIFYPLLIWGLMFGLGYLNHRQHLNNPSKLVINSQERLYTLKVRELNKKERSSLRFTAVTKDDSILENSPLVAVTLNFGTDTINLQPDDLLLAYGKMTPIESPRNPYQFNYKDFMAHKNIHLQLQLEPSQIIQIRKGRTTILGSALNIQQYLSNSLNNTKISKASKEFTKALVLGDKKYLDPQLYAAYANAGTIHFLAVSGLHVGILLWIVRWLLGFLTRIKKGRYIRTVILLLTLWSFAFITGLSPSVTRAVCMFSFFTLGSIGNRPINPLNSLFLSYFILLLLQPNWLFQVGFQLSYLAVLSILWLQPKLQALWKPKLKLSNYLWGLITVSLSAQIGVAPLSIYYFQQFPGIFLFTNTLVLPFLPLLLTGGILVIILSACNVPLNGVFKMYDFIIQQLNGFMTWAGSQEQFIFTFSKTPMEWIIAIYITAGLLALWRIHYFKKLVFALLIAVNIILVKNQIHRTQKSQELILFDKSRHTIIGMENATSLIVFGEMDKDLYAQYPIKQWQKSKNKPIINQDLSKVFQFNGEDFMHIDSTGAYAIINNCNLLLSGSPKIHLGHLLEQMHPKLVIADGSNYRSYITRWKKSCERKGIPFYNTREMGAIVWNQQRNP